MNPSEPERDIELTGGTLAVVRSFKNAYRSLERRRGRETHKLGDSGVSQSQFELLLELRKHGPSPIGELAHSAGLSVASVSQMVDRLAEQGQVEKLRSEEDRRIVMVELSEHGKAALDPIVDRWRQSWMEGLESVPEEDLETASRVLDLIASIYQDRAEDQDGPGSK